ncbi:hypothetical protein CLV59_101117 [Chitinophaga dinghuensis]|uniref:Uncharacterized protein n=1 Tax=Chitinophaga dinghuensis TaxID=1539050 RepID=A0A327WB37_9BACT|nr:hypothetical protein [Chitinophaga dinghuensis]RAJ87368.1 hypothetical protein CLV59_101117 [Chitinophaga dinghuensis]
MEKIYALIEKLQELRYSGADLQTISYYVQMLQAEVLHARNRQHQQSHEQQMQSTSGQIAVIMPARQEPFVTVPEPAVQTTTLPSNKPELTETDMPFKEMPVVAVQQTAVPENIISPQAATVTPVPEAPSVNHHFEPVSIPENIPAPVVPAPVTPQFVQENTPAPPAPVHPIYEPPVSTSPFVEETRNIVAPSVQPVTPEPVRPQYTQETPAPQPVPGFAAAAAPVAKEYKPAPTLFDQPAPAPSNGSSLNDRLAQQQVELGQKLGQQRIQDLRNAIGINDKYQFIGGLFNNDKDLYERSIKTINDFDTLQEADRWIQREIKILQGWQDEDPLVKHFYTLLRKRFS